MKHLEMINQAFSRVLRRLSPHELDEDTLSFVQDTLSGAIHYHLSIKERTLSERDIVNLVDCMIGLMNLRTATATAVAATTGKTRKSRH